MAGIEFVSTPVLEQQSFEEGGAFENTRFQFSSGGKPLTFQFSGKASQSWETNPMDPPDPVLDYAYFGLHLRPLNTDFSLGRMLIDEGTSEELMDGVYSRTNFTSRSGLSFFSGRTVSAANDLVGGRLSYRLNDRAAVSMSYLNESAGPQTLREEGLVDLRLHPFSKLALSGSSLFDLETGKWTQHSYSAKIGPFGRATFLFDASLQRNGDPGSSVLWPSVGAGVRYSLSRCMAVGFDVGRTEDPSAGPSFSEGVRLSYTSLQNWKTRLSVIRRIGEDSDSLEMNLHAAKKAGKFEASLDLQRIMYGGDPGSGDNATSAALGLAYEFSPAYRLAAEVQESKTADSQVDLSAFLKLEYRFGS